MTPQHVISQLLESDTKYPKNLELLKKIILTAYLGRLQINGLPPDNKIALAHYLFDSERVIFDFIGLSEASKAKFKKWLIEPYLLSKEKAYPSTATINEYRGYTAEEGLSWWGSVVNWFKGIYADYWKINDLSLSLHYQLLGIEISHANSGILIGFNQFLAPNTGSKYKKQNDQQSEALGNTKRVLITDQLIDHLTGFNLSQLKFETLCKTAHPHAIEVTDEALRYQDMHDFRYLQRFVTKKSWIVRFWLWIKSFFYHDLDVEESKITPVVDHSLVLLHDSEKVKIYRRSLSNKIIVMEKRPDINIVVFCGGGSKIYGHVGAAKAMNESHIHPKRFAGSSAGAIMALLCYLGYKAEAIEEIFKHFKQEHLIYFNVDRNGLSHSYSLKTALDYLIAKKLEQICSKYQMDYPGGKITFATLDEVRKRCPGCGIGDELIVTATQKKMRKTRFFSLSHSPDMEVSNAVRASASFPVLYKPALIDGEDHNDGGVLMNLPTAVYNDENSTLLTSEQGANFEVLAIQFDNGTERSAIDHIMKDVYRENFILNWIYSVLTGVSDPVSGWVNDRLELRRYGSQAVIIDVGKVTSANFTVGDEVRARMIQSGYEATKNYLQARYEPGEDRYINKEFLYSAFSSLGDLLAYCCHRGNKYWFDVVNNLIVQSKLSNTTELVKHSLNLRNLYFSSEEKRPVSKQVQENGESSMTFFGYNATASFQVDSSSKKRKLFLVIYPLILKLISEWVLDKKDKKRLEQARHNVSLHSPLKCLKYLNTIEKDRHILLHIFITVLNAFQKQASDSMDAIFTLIHQCLDKPNVFLGHEFYGQWALSFEESVRFLKLFNEGDSNQVVQVVKGLKKTSLLQAASCDTKPDVLEAGCFRRVFSC